MHAQLITVHPYSQEAKTYTVTHGYARKRQGERIYVLTDGDWFHAIYPNGKVETMIGLRDAFFNDLKAVSAGTTFVSGRIKAQRLDDATIVSLCNDGPYTLLR